MQNENQDKRVLAEAYMRQIISEATLGNDMDELQRKLDKRCW